MLIYIACNLIEQCKHCSMKIAANLNDLDTTASSGMYEY